MHSGRAGTSNILTPQAWYNGVQDSRRRAEHDHFTQADAPEGPLALYVSL